MKATKQDIRDMGRLKKRSQFLYVADSGQKWVSDSVILQLSQPAAEQRSSQNHPLQNNQSDKSIRFGITATKRLGGAPVRNRVKRRLRAAVKDVMAASHDLHPAENEYMDIVLIGRAATTNLPYDKLKKDIRWCLKRLRDKIKEAPKTPKAI